MAMTSHWIRRFMLITSEEEFQRSRLNAEADGSAGQRTPQQSALSLTVNGGESEMLSSLLDYVKSPTRILLLLDDPQSSVCYLQTRRDSLPVKQSAGDAEKYI